MAMTKTKEMKQTLQAKKSAFEKDKFMMKTKKWTYYYRNNLHKFCEDYLNINYLKLFQIILLTMMDFSNHFMFIASRGLGKTFLVALYCVCRCVLYPGTKIIVASGNLNQAKEIIGKIEKEFIPKSPLLNMEIKKINTTGSPYVLFGNGSFIEAVASNQGARSRRAHIIIVDEFRLVPKDIIEMVLKRFIASERTPGFMSTPEYKNEKEKYIERNKEFYMTSAWFKNHWSWLSLLSYAKNLISDKKYFLCAFPYQMAIKEGLLNKEAVEEEMSESTFNQVVFEMEMETKWFGQGKDAFFQYDEIVSCRNSTDIAYVYKDIKYVGKAIKALEKEKDSFRVLAIDIAVMAAKKDKKNKNDASSITSIEFKKNKNKIQKKVIYLENFDGKHGKLQALKVRQLEKQLEIDYIAIDKNGVGNGILDYLLEDITDEKTGEIYYATNCMNNQVIADKYLGSNRFPVKNIYAVDTTPAANSNYAFKLKDAINSNILKLPLTEKAFDELMQNNKEYQKLNESQKLILKLPYIQTTLLQNELLGLNGTVDGNLLKIKESSTARKDRYSSLAYANFFCDFLLGDKKIRRNSEDKKEKRELLFRQPKLRK